MNTTNPTNHINVQRHARTGFLLAIASGACLVLPSAIWCFVAKQYPAPLGVCFASVLSAAVFIIGAFFCLVWSFSSFSTGDRFALVVVGGVIIIFVSTMVAVGLVPSPMYIVSQDGVFHVSPEGVTRMEERKHEEAAWGTWIKKNETTAGGSK